MSLINSGSVNDIHSYLKCNEKSYTIEYLQQELKKEMAGQNRSSVIKLLDAVIKRKIKNK